MIRQRKKMAMKKNGGKIAMKSKGGRIAMKSKGGRIAMKKKGGTVYKKKEKRGCSYDYSCSEGVVKEKRFHRNKDEEKEVMNGLFTKQHPTLQVLGAERVYSQSREISWGISTRYGDCSYNHAEQKFEFSSNLHWV